MLYITTYLTASRHKSYLPYRKTITLKFIIFFNATSHLLFPKGKAEVHIHTTALNATVQCIMFFFFFFFEGQCIMYTHFSPFVSLCSKGWVYCHIQTRKKPSNTLCDSGIELQLSSATGQPSVTNEAVFFYIGIF